MTYQQHLASGMVKMGESDLAGAAQDFTAALSEARRLDPGGAREAEVLGYFAQLKLMQGDMAGYQQDLDKVAVIFAKFGQGG